MDIIEIIKEDYRHFPLDQSYHIYAEDVYFQDPLTKFTGLDKYRQTIAFIRTWFKEIELELRGIDRTENRISTRWQLSWHTPLPWYPRITIAGSSELLLNDQELIISHIDYWEISPLDVIKQHFSFKKRY
jgi:hypothetical protein